MEEYIFAFFSLMLSSKIKSEDILHNNDQDFEKDPLLFYTAKLDNELN